MLTCQVISDKLLEIIRILDQILSKNESNFINFRFKHLMNSHKILYKVLLNDTFYLNDF